jgi:hypothetical protein
MIEFVIGVFIFCIVLFVYLHIQFHLKTSDDLEMYEVDQASKDKLEEVCDIRQPVLFDFENQDIMSTSSKDYVIASYQAFEIKIRNVKEREKEKEKEKGKEKTDDDTEMYMPLPLHSAVKLFEEDKQSTYISENNTDFLQESGVIKHFQHNDQFLRPYMVSNCNYDILMGSVDAITPFRYEINYRNFFLLTQGSAQIKMAPPKSTKYLYPDYDYENFEFRSPVNPWDPQPNYTADFNKIKCLEFTLLPGKTIFIPAFWWYSIKLGKNTSISCFRYRTYMNNIAISPYIAMYALQIQNVKRNVARKVSINDLNLHQSDEEDKKNIDI